MQPGCTTHNESLPKEQFKSEVERELTGRESEPSELIYFKGLQEPGAGDRTSDRYGGSHARIRQGAGVLSGDDLRGFPGGGAHLESGNPKILLLSMMRLFRLLPATLRQEFLQQISEAA